MCCYNLSWYRSGVGGMGRSGRWYKTEGHQIHSVTELLLWTKILSFYWTPGMVGTNCDSSNILKAYLITSIDGHRVAALNCMAIDNYIISYINMCLHHVMPHTYIIHTDILCNKSVRIETHSEYWGESVCVVTLIISIVMISLCIFSWNENYKTFSLRLYN